MDCRIISDGLNEAIKSHNFASERFDINMYIEIEDIIEEFLQDVILFEKFKNEYIILTDLLKHITIELILEDEDLILKLLFEYECFYSKVEKI